MVMMALVLISSISQGTMVKGLLSAMLGITAALPGLNASDGQLRLTFGHESMTDGFNLLPVLLGIFVMSQLIKDTVEINKKATSISLKNSRLFPKLSTWKKQTVNLVRSSIVGTWIGILPGIGASISSMVSYGLAKAFSKTPEKFGTGHEEGVVASEAANNANAGGALIPLITMGIPGAPVDAILLGAMIMHRIQPGPLLFQTNGELVWSLMGGYLVANILMFIVMLFSTRAVARIININRAYLVPVIFVFCVIGAYALSNRIFDVWLVLAFGIVGFFLDKAKFPLGPFVIGYVLTGFLEKNLRSGLQSSDGSFLPMISRPLSLLFIVVAVFFLFLPFYTEWNRKRKQNQPS